MRPPLPSPQLLPPTRLLFPPLTRPSTTPQIRLPRLRRALSTTSPKQAYRPRRSTDPAPEPSELRNPLDTVTAHRLELQRRAYHIRRMWIAGAGIAVCTLCTVSIVAFIDPGPAREKKIRTEAPPGLPSPFEVGGGEKERAKEIEIAGKVATGTSSVPWFPRTIRLPGETGSVSPALPAGVGGKGEEYHLLGLGIRTVSFLRIQVYVVGLYVAASDMAALQAAFVRQAADVEAASTLVPAEKEKLKGMLLDGRDSEVVWDKVLRESGVRSVIRVVPTRNTDWAHLRDGWVRAVEGKGKRKRGDVEAKFGDKGGLLLAGLDEDDSFGEAVGRFKAIFSAGGRKAVAKGKAILLERDGKGVLKAWVQGESEKERKGEEAFEIMGELRDERVSRSIWLGYLAGDSVASPAARQSVVDGVMEAVGRPVGTLETQVV
ncbi:Altered inheritance of mitochondria protein 18 mitochondrial [Thelotrema lepadinum]|nr:Altered inheritance of mitochondria protein 18 mitochondrial [Thelotrema lepadinum]